MAYMLQTEWCTFSFVQTVQTVSMPKPVDRNATHLLFKLAKESTWLGGKHWKKAKILEDSFNRVPQDLERKCPKGSCRPRPKLEIKRLVRERPSAKRLEPEFTEPFEPLKQKKQTRSLYGRPRNAALLPEPCSEHWNQKKGQRRGSLKAIGQKDQALFEEYERAH